MKIEIGRMKIAALVMRQDIPGQPEHVSAGALVLMGAMHIGLRGMSVYGTKILRIEHKNCGFFTQ